MSDITKVELKLIEIKTTSTESHTTGAYTLIPHNPCIIYRQDTQRHMREHIHFIELL